MKSTVKDPGNFSFYSKIRDLVVPEMNEKREKVMLKAGEIQAGYYDELWRNRDRWSSTYKKLTATKQESELILEDFLKEDDTLVNPIAKDAEIQILRRFAHKRTKNMRGLEFLNIGTVKEGPGEEQTVTDKTGVTVFLMTHMSFMALEPGGLQRGLMVFYRDARGEKQGHATAMYHNRGGDTKNGFSSTQIAASSLGESLSTWRYSSAISGKFFTWN